MRTPLAALLLATSAQAQTITTVPTHFAHPGLLNSAPEYATLASRAAAGAEPRSTWFAELQHSHWARLDWVAHPVATVTDGPTGAEDIGCSAEIQDATAAYTDALVWKITGDTRYADLAGQILDAWSATLQTHAGFNWYLQASWAGSLFPLSAELLRAYPGWSGHSRLRAMFVRAFLPLLHDRLSYGNRELSVDNALVAIGVFDDDPAAFAEGIGHWQSYLPEYFYSPNDGQAPARPSYWTAWPSASDLLNYGQLASRSTDAWLSATQPSGLLDDRTMVTRWSVPALWYNPGTFQTGIDGETGRDLSHAEMSLTSAVNVAEIAWHQGIDLYSQGRDRLTRFMEGEAAFRLGAPVPQNLYGGHLNPGNGLNPTWEIAYNHFHGIDHLSLPQTEKLLPVIRSASPDGVSPAPPGVFATRLAPKAGWIQPWESFTHGGLN